MLSIGLTRGLSGRPHFFKRGKEVNVDYDADKVVCDPPVQARPVGTTQPSGESKQFFFPTCDLSGFPMNENPVRAGGLWNREVTDSRISCAYKFYTWDELPDDIVKEYNK